MILHRLLIGLHQLAHFDRQLFNFLQADFAIVNVAQVAGKPLIHHLALRLANCLIYRIHHAPPYTRVREDTATQEVISLSSASRTPLFAWILLTVCFLGAN